MASVQQQQQRQQQRQSMVDCTPEPLKDLTVVVKDGEEEEETNSPTEVGSCVSADSNSNLAADSGESEPETELEEESDEEQATPVPPEGECHQKQASAESMKLNDAFLALEAMRKANLEVEFGGKAIPNVTLLHEYCTMCLHEQKQKEETKMKRLSRDVEFMKNPYNERRRKWMKQLMTRLRTQKKSPPCLICTSPVCRKHCCKDFRKEKINVCGKCSPLFTMNFVVAAIAKDADDEETRQKSLAHMIDSYDRALLMLRYSAQYIDEIAAALENRSKTSDHIGLASSSTGLLSGFTGAAAVAAQFVAAAAILSPAGPPLIMASIFFGASAAAASTGTEAINYYSEPNQLACKIIALHDLIRSLLGVTEVLKDAIVRGHIDPRHFTEMGPTKKRSTYWKSRLPQKVVKPVVETVAEKEEDDEVEEKDAKAEAKTQTASTTTESANAEQPSSPLAKVEEDKGKPDTEEADKEAAPEESTVDAIAETDNKSKTEATVAQPEPQPVHYSLADIDDDDDDQPVAEEKQDAETAVTESTSFESEADPLSKEENKEESLASPANGEEHQGAKEEEKEDGQAVDSEKEEGDQDVSPAKEGVEGASGDADAVAYQPKEGGTDKKQVTTIAPSNKRTALSRAMTNSMKIAQFASIACVMLSAATIIMETKNLRDTLESLRRGSPCEKAAMLRKIKGEIEDLPDTRVVIEGCDSYLRATAAKEKTAEKPAEKPAESEENAEKPAEKPAESEVKENEHPVTVAEAE